jgi:hypothetical protein
MAADNADILTRLRCDARPRPQTPQQRGRADAMTDTDQTMPARNGGWRQ